MLFYPSSEIGYITLSETGNIRLCFNGALYCFLTGSLAIMAMEETAVAIDHKDCQRHKITKKFQFSNNVFTGLSTKQGSKERTAPILELNFIS